MAEIEPIEIINNNPEIIDRRKIKNIKKVVEEDTPPVEQIDKRKIKRALWRYITLEDGTKKYNKNPCDPLYYKTYYDEKRKAIDGAIMTCQLCHREVTSGHIHRHQRSNICKKNYNLRLNTDDKPSEKLI